MKFNVGDIVYFNSEYTPINRIYGYKEDPIGISKAMPMTGYKFLPGDRYRVDVYRVDKIKEDTFITSGVITNLEDGSSHFASSTMWPKLISEKEWRDQRINILLQ